MRSFLLAAALALPAAALADDHPPISNRDYALDLSPGAALGSSRFVSMGGAGIAIAEGSADTQVNAAAPAVRPSTSNGTWDWDWHLDWLYPGFGSDFDNNGVASMSGGRDVMFTVGVLGQYREWGLGLTSEYEAISGGGTDQPAARAVFAKANLVLARSFLAQQLTLGLGLRIGGFEIDELPSQTKLFALGGSSIQLGSLYRPNDESYRVGLSASLPVSGTNPTAQGCDPNACNGYVLPDEVVVPWELGVGVAYRFAATPWNQHVHTPWRDERALTLALDLKLTGAVAKGEGLEEFLNQRWQASGRSVTVTARAGGEYEWIPGWLRVRGGTYWEPTRFVDANGRMHLTFGIEGRVLAFDLWGSPYRLRIGATADVARAYGNGGLSIGFW